MAAGDVDVGITTPDARKCAFFDGTDDHINCGNNVSLRSPKTIALWFNSKDLTTTLALGGQRTDAATNNSWSLFSGITDYRIRFLIDKDGGQQPTAVTNSTNLNENTWYHLVAVADGTDIRIYINGLLDCTPAAAAFTPFASAADVKFAAISTITANFFKGLLKNIQMYSNALTATEVLKLYNSGSPISNGLKGHWKLDEAEGETTAVDSSGFGNDGTMTGALFGNYESDLAAAIKAQRGAATDSFFLCDVNGGSQVLHTQITEA